jgi:hypothetical protein
MYQELMKLKRSQGLKFAFVCGCLLAGSADAADPGDAGGPVVRMGGVSIYPGLSLVETSNDNLFRSDVNKKSSRITVLSPSVLLQANRGANAYSLSYRADIGRYAQSSADNYSDQNLTGLAELSFSTRSLLRITPLFAHGHDDRGSTYSTPTESPNVWNKRGLEASFTYGTVESIGRIVIDASGYAVRYQNNRSVTTAFDKDLSSIGGAFYYRLSPKVFSLIQVSDMRINYLDPVTTLSGNERRILLGATWNATAQTSGSFKLGQLRKSFDSSAHKTFKGPSWEGNIRWSPREFIYLNWVSGRRSDESTGVGDFVMSTYNTLDLGYDLNGRTTLHLNAGKLTEKFEQAGRTDDTPFYGFKADYKLRKWLILGAEYSHAVKTSTGFTGPSPNYTNNKLSVGIRTEY